MEQQTETNQEPVNVDISKFIIENFEFSNYELLRRFDDVSYNPSYRSLYDSYKLPFYNNKAQNFDTDLLSVNTSFEGFDYENMTPTFQELNIELHANNTYLDYNDDGSINYETSLYYGYYCFPNNIVDWTPTEEPKYGSLYVTDNPQFYACTMRTSEGYPGYASVVFILHFCDLKKKRVRKTPEVYGTVICNQNIQTPITYNFTITFPKKLPSK
jgi:hypothetical protein